MNKASQALQLIKAYSNEKGYVKGLDTLKIASLLKVNGHDAAKILWKLNKDGLLGFTELKVGGGHSQQIRLRLTKLGMDTLEVSPSETEDVIEEHPDEELEQPEEQPLEPEEQSSPSPKYPLIKALLNRQNLAGLAAEALKELGAVELFRQAQELAELSDFEKEVIALVKDHPDIVNET